MLLVSFQIFIQFFWGFLVLVVWSFTPNNRVRVLYNSRYRPFTAIRLDEHFFLVWLEITFLTQPNTKLHRDMM